GFIPTFQNGRLEGKACVWVWKRNEGKENEFLSQHILGFAGGKIVQSGGMNQDVLATFEAYLEKIHPARCDVHHSPGNPS
ncbi:MAG: hypothetical protein LBD06_03790, partial [Candidatus Accumulibacter sp.]|nr:hypothetical protein [Accumulibacter sp.]